MLVVFGTSKQLDYRQLAAVYEESNRLNGASIHGQMAEDTQLLLAEQDFYDYLHQFLADPFSRYAVWLLDGKYVAAVRIEAYRDGCLISGLETIPGMRNKGYGKALLNETLRYLSREGVAAVYSHVDRHNAPSAAVHKACGFQKELDHAVYIDGSVSTMSYTYCFRIL